MYHLTTQKDVIEEYDSMADRDDFLSSCSGDSNFERGSELDFTMTSIKVAESFREMSIYTDISKQIKEKQDAIQLSVFTECVPDEKSVFVHCERPIDVESIYDNSGF